MMIVVDMWCMMIVIETASSRSAELRPGTFALACAKDYVLEELALGRLE